jgi:uncharacterized damage-inducible protein DinB
MELNDVAPLPGYQEPYGLLCAILQDGSNEWRGEMDKDLPAEAMVWQAYPGGHSIGGCILHNVAVEVFWFEQYVLDRVFDPEEKRLLQWDETDVDEWRWAVPHREPLSWYFALQDRFRARILESIKSFPAPDAPIAYDGGKARTPRWVFGHVIQHEAYHGGQAVLLQKLWQETQT